MFQHCQSKILKDNIVLLWCDLSIQEESDLLENAEEERKKNKKRAREKNMKEKEHMSPVKFTSDLTDEYKQVQTEVDRILQAPGHEASMRKK